MCSGKAWVLAVNRPDQSRPEHVIAVAPKRSLSIASPSLLAASAILFIAVLVANLQSPRIALALLISFITAVFVFALLLADAIRHLHKREQHAKTVFADREQEFQQMADNIQEVFWVIDAETKNATYVNPAYETITGHTCESLIGDPRSYQKTIHPDDRVRFLERLDQATHTGQFDERFRIVKPDGEVRWVWVRGFPGTDKNGKVIRLGGTALDVTALKTAEDQVAENLAKANSAWAEAEGLRKATLALTQDLHMDSVLDALLSSLSGLVPYSCARVLVPDGGNWMALGEKSCPQPTKKTPRVPLTFAADSCPFFERIISEHKRVLVRDTQQQEGWQTFEGHSGFRSWLCVPLVASEEFLGFLSVGHTQPDHFTEDHLRRAEVLAIPAAVAIQNARLYMTAEIYGSELAKRLADLQNAERALNWSEAGRRISEEKFHKVFHSSPVAFSITTLEEGRFVEVNAAFETRYGYCREELLGRTVHELRIWEDPADRRLLVTTLRQGGPIRNVITRVRTKSGQVKLTAYSADRIEFDDQTCVLAVSADLPAYDAKSTN
jgi:PAS domain S-box-containing protein